MHEIYRHCIIIKIDRTTRTNHILYTKYHTKGNKIYTRSKQALDNNENKQDHTDNHILYTKLKRIRAPLHNQ